MQDKLVGRERRPEDVVLSEGIQAADSPPSAEMPIKAAEALPSKAQARQAPKTGALENVKHIIAVGSGKGGVGKSTVSLNLAMALQKFGKRVGLIDADVYGPSQQHMTRAARPQMLEGDLIDPPVVEGLKVISVAMFAAAGQAQMLRGPMAAQVLRQFLTQVAWGELDYLLIDLPPGTGDIQLTLAQSVPISGAVLVTTPQELSLIDVRKAVSMFQTLNVPLLGVIENMSYFVCDQCTKKHYLFGQGGGQRLAAEFGTNLLAEIPMDPKVAEASDLGRPALVHLPSSPVTETYQKIADRLLAQQLLQKDSDGALGYFLLEWKKL